MPVGKSAISGSPYLGVYVRAGERAALVPPSAPPALEGELQRSLGISAVRTTVNDSEILGALVAINSFGAVLGDEPDAAERSALERLAPVTTIRTRQNAMGNNVLVNDRGALVHPEFGDEAVAAIHRGLQVPVRRGTVAGLGTVGMAGLATNRGVVLHPKATDREAEFIAELLGAPVHRSTANFGVPIVGACLVANSRGMLVGRPTTPVEIVHLQEGLQIFD